MCGIAGIYSQNGNISEQERIELKSAVTRIQHRGPNESGSIDLPQFSAAHARLSIIDISAGQQPMIDPETGSVIVFNGEIYNYLELRDELQRDGIQFQTHSDTEVILLGYRAHGIDFVKRLNGMFSFAVYDKPSQTLHLCKDRYGEKPLYYFLSNGRIFFASELSALRAFSQFPNQIDEHSLLKYLTSGWVPGPGSLFQQVNQLAPAHYLSVSSSGQTIECYYYRGESSEKYRAMDDEEIEHSLAQAVKLRLRADVPVATLLSGGLDSSLITLFAQQASNQKIKTFAFGWKGQSDERPYANKVARLVGTDHQEIELDTESFVTNFPTVVAAMDSPMADSAAYVLFQLCQKIAEHDVKVVLSGEGGDELFGGYPWYSVDRSAKTVLKRYLMGKRKTAEDYVLGKHAFSIDELAFGFSASTLNDFREKSIEEFYRFNNDANGRIAYDFENMLPWGLLPKVDRMSMANSVEVRAPFLDHELVERWVIRHNKEKVHRNELKFRMKRIAVERKLLPESIVYRRKQGMNLPITWWIQKNESLFRDILLSQNSIIKTLFKNEAIESWFKDIRATRATGWSHTAQKIWASSVFEIWQGSANN